MEQAFIREILQAGQWQGRISAENGAKSGIRMDNNPKHPSGACKKECFSGRQGAVRLNSQKASGRPAPRAVQACKAARVREVRWRDVRMDTEAEFGLDKEVFLLSKQDMPE